MLALCHLCYTGISCSLDGGLSLRERIQQKSLTDIVHQARNQGRTVIAGMHEELLTSTVIIT